MVVNVLSVLAKDLPTYTFLGVDKDAQSQWEHLLGTRIVCSVLFAVLFLVSHMRLRTK